MDDAATSGSPPDRCERRLWLGVLLPPASWIVELLARYMATRWSHYHAMVWPLRLVTLLCLAALSAGALICWRTLKEARASSGNAAGAPPPTAQQRHDRATLAGWGLWLAAFFLLLILAQAYPVFVINVGEIT